VTCWVIVLSFSLQRQHHRERREEMGVEVVIPAFAGRGGFLGQGAVSDVQ
jgi:hypothetical protein